MLNKIIINEYDCTNKEKFFKSVSKYLCDYKICDNEKKIYESFLKREESGNTLISENIALPHIENNCVKIPTITFVNLGQNPISWNENYKIKFIIILCISGDESEGELKEIKQFMHKLADEEFEQKLMKCNNLVDLREII